VLWYFKFRKHTAEEPAVLHYRSRRDERFLRNIGSLFTYMTKFISTRKTVGCYIRSSCYSRHLKEGNQALCDSWFPVAQVGTLELDHPVEQTSWTNCTVESTEGGGGLSVWLLLQLHWLHLLPGFGIFLLRGKLFRIPLTRSLCFLYVSFLKLCPKLTTIFGIINPTNLLLKINVSLNRNEY
jgi:hypothetical protein